MMASLIMALRARHIMFCPRGMELLLQPTSAASSISPDASDSHLSHITS